jgi:hypothetical protein
MRYECDDPLFAGDFIEFSDTFSRAEQRALNVESARDEAAFLDLLRPKIKALHLSCIDAEAITRREDFTSERTEAMDLRLFGWFAVVWVRHLRGLLDLGNALGRNSSAISVAIRETALPNLNHS